MIVEDFIARGQEQFQELEAFVKTSHNAAFRAVPMYNSRKNTYKVSLRYGISELGKVEQLREKWQKENQLRTKQKSENAFSNFFAMLSFSSS